jgi:tetratricopeptide (TPR) repeat protein
VRVDWYRVGVRWVGFVLLVMGLSACASTSPKPDEDPLERAKSALEEGRVSTAVKTLEPIAAKNPSAEILRVLGEAYLRRGQGNQAFSTLSKSLEMGKPDEALFRSLGRSAALIGRVELAIDYLERGTGSKESPFDSLLELGRLYLDVDRPKAAVRVATRAISREPDLAEGYALLGQASILSGSAEEGFLAMTRAIQISPEDPGLHFRMGNIWVSQGQFESGCASYRKTIELNPRHPDALRAFGTSLVVLEQYREGIKMLEKARKFAPDNPEICNSLGVAYTAVGLYDDANEVLEYALEFVPEAEILYVNLSEVKLRQGNVSDSLAALRRGKQAIKGVSRSGTRLEDARRRVVIFDGIVRARCVSGDDVADNREAILETLIRPGLFQMKEVMVVAEEIRSDQELQKSFDKAVASCP